MGDTARTGGVRHDARVRRRDQALAANQGLYNGFLVAALVLGLVGPADHRFAFAVFGLSCVVVAGLYGAATVSRRILFVQAVPAGLALIAVLVAG